MPQGRPKIEQVNADTEWGENRLLARALLIKSRLYRYFALAFAILGFAIFLFLLFNRVEGNVLEALRNPATIAVILVPFLPAFVLSLMAQRFERQFAKLTNKPEEAPAKAASSPPAPDKK